MHRVQRILRDRQLVSAPPGASVFDIARTMTEASVGAIPILDGDELVGIFSERDLVGRVVVAGRDPHTTRVEEVMTRNVVTASLDDPVDRCLEQMKKTGCRHLPVVEGGRVLSMISMRDLLRDEVEEKGEEIRHLRVYLNQAPN